MADAVAESAPAGDDPARADESAEHCVEGGAEAFSGRIYALVVLSFAVWVVLLVILQRAFA
jgi:hypothetical protein